MHTSNRLLPDRFKMAKTWVALAETLHADSEALQSLPHLAGDPLLFSSWIVQPVPCRDTAVYACVTRMRLVARPRVENRRGEVATDRAAQ